MALPSNPLVPLAVPLIAKLNSGSLTGPEDSMAGFPCKLFGMLENEDESVVGWQSHGRAFQIRDSTHFVTRVLPKYFAKSKTSFFRSQLSLYGFKRITKGRDANCYYHELFLRGRQDLLPSLQKANSSLFKHKQDMEPDFYKMESSPSPRERAQSLAKAIHKVHLIAQEESPKRPVRPKTNTSCGPLRVPGRLLYQSTETPTSLRFAATYSNRFQQTQAESLRWIKPLQLQQISNELQLEHHTWQTKTPSPWTATLPYISSSKNKNESQSSGQQSQSSQALKDIVLMLD